VGAGFIHPPGYLAFYRRVSSELLPKSFLCSCAAWVHQIRVEISYPLIARVHLRAAVLMGRSE